jgi:ABC-type Zn uptake system ZnuABC Zn-binding protein ZnuA
MRALAIAALLTISVLACACGDDTAARGAGATVVATTTQAADLARAVAGKRGEVVGLIPANADPHDYEVRPDDLKALADADLVVRSGGDLDDWLNSAIESSGADARQLALLDHVRVRQTDGETDPHWWQDPRDAETAVRQIERALSDADPGGAAVYERNAREYTARLSALDRGIASCIDEIPPARRKLVTTHDALGYYADRYGLEIVGAVIPSLSSQAQASAGEVDQLVETIRREGVKAIFAESSVNPELEELVAEQSGATVGKALWADTLGPPGSDGDTYLKSIASNTRAIASGLSGGMLDCALPE